MINLHRAWRLAATSRCKNKTRILYNYIRGIIELQAKTTAEWLYRKKLISLNELITGRALALLLEYRWSCVWPGDSTIACYHNFLPSRPDQLPTEFDLNNVWKRDKASVDGGEIKPASIEEVRVPERDASDASRREWLINSRDELLRIHSLFKRALPECPDLFVRLGGAVTERVTVHELAYRDVPLICSALYVLKEHWRYDLLEDLIDEAVGHLDRSTQRPEDLPERTRRDSSPAQHLSSESLSELFGGDAPDEGAELGSAISPTSFVLPADHIRSAATTRGINPDIAMRNAKKGAPASSHTRR